MEEQGGEGGPLEDAADDKGRITRAGVERLRNAMMAERYEAAFGGAGVGAPGASAETGGREPGGRDRPRTIQEALEGDEEWEVLARCRRLFDAKDEAAKVVRDAQAALDEQVLARYATLTEAEVRTLVIEDKWFARLRDAIRGEVERLIGRLTDRIMVLEDRYARPLPALEREVEAFGAKVEAHLERMGLSP